MALSGMTEELKNVQVCTGPEEDQEAEAVLVESTSSVITRTRLCQKRKKLGMDAHGKLIAEGIIGKDIVAEPEAK
ncbi:MAG: hypothetical protein ACLTER_20555 [Ruminococcus sp.]